MTQILANTERTGEYSRPGLSTFAQWVNGDIEVSACSFQSLEPYDPFEAQITGKLGRTPLQLLANNIVELSGVVLEDGPPLIVISPQELAASSLGQLSVLYTDGRGHSRLVGFSDTGVKDVSRIEGHELEQGYWATVFQTMQICRGEKWTRIQAQTPPGQRLSQQNTYNQVTAALKANDLSVWTLKQRKQGLIGMLVGTIVNAFDYRNDFAT